MLSRITCPLSERNLRFIKPSFFSSHNEPKLVSILLSAGWFIVRVVDRMTYLNLDDFLERYPKMSVTRSFVGLAETLFFEMNSEISAFVTGYIRRLALALLHALVSCHSRR